MSNEYIVLRSLTILILDEIMGSSFVSSLLLILLRNRKLLITFGTQEKETRTKKGTFAPLKT